jgi:DNA-binding LacI/PurR family transcriptional regulator
MQLRPERKTLPAQAAEILRQRIAAGEWTSFLPPERQLCTQMGLGRNTLRLALQQLEKDRWIGLGRPGCRRAILDPPAAKSSRPISRTVILLVPVPDYQLPPSMLRIAELLRTVLHDEGYRLEITTSPAFQLAHVDRLLSRHVRHHDAALWLLIRAPQPVQRWFDQHSIPALIIGYPHTGIRLPFVTEDIEAAAQHAADLLLARGHRHIALVRRGPTLAGHEVVQQTLSRRLAAPTVTGTELAVVQASSQAEDLCARLNQLLAADRPPTSYVTLNISDAITIVTHLGRRGLITPQHYSLISLFDDPALDAVVPAVTRYRTNRKSFINRVCAHILALVRHTPPARRRQPLMPDFVKGQTLGNCPSLPR